jgi:hypothetical protein
VDDNGAVAEEAAEAFLGCGIEIEIRGLESPRAGDIAEFAGEVACLAGLGLGWVAGCGFAADEGVEMGEGSGAVARGGNWIDVEVVDCGRIRLELIVKRVRRRMRGIVRGIGEEKGKW